MKTKNISYAISLLFLLFISSCKKEDPQPQSGSATPVFSFSGNINGVPVLLQAGMNNYFISPSYSIDANGVYEFVCDLKESNCVSNCPNSLEILIKDYRPFLVLPTMIDSSIVPGYYSFATPSGTSSQYEQVFVADLQNGTAQTYNWNFGDGTSLIETSPTVTHTYLHPGIYNVSVNIQSTGSCTSSITNSIALGQAGNAFLAIYSSDISGDTATFTPIPIGGIAPFTYLWNFGDGSTSTSANPSHKYSSSGVYLTTLSMTDATGYTNVQNLNISVKTTTICASNFFAGTTKSIYNPLNLSGVIVEWQDGNGLLWTSYNNSQSSAKSIFKVISVENYLNNTSGQPTKKIHVNMSCTLYKGSNSITINNADVVFCIAYK